jgi:hypothetical protein
MASQRNDYGRHDQWGTDAWAKDSFGSAGYPDTSCVALNCRAVGGTSGD